MGTKIRHPQFPNIVHEVDEPDSWLAAGWIEDSHATPSNMDDTGVNDGSNDKKN